MAPQSQHDQAASFLPPSDYSSQILSLRTGSRPNQFQVVLEIIPDFCLPLPHHVDAHSALPASPWPAPFRSCRPPCLPPEGFHLQTTALGSSMQMQPLASDTQELDDEYQLPGPPEGHLGATFPTISGRPWWG